MGDDQKRSIKNRCASLFKHLLFGEVFLKSGANMRGAAKLRYDIIESYICDFIILSTELTGSAFVPARMNPCRIIMRFV